MPTLFKCRFADVPGDLSASTFRTTSSMGPRERAEIYGGDFLLVGVVDASGIQCREEDAQQPDVYATVTLVDEAGKEMTAEKHFTRVIQESADPQWDGECPAHCPMSCPPQCADASCQSLALLL